MVKYQAILNEEGVFIHELNDDIAPEEFVSQNYGLDKTEWKVFDNKPNIEMK